MVDFTMIAQGIGFIGAAVIILSWQVQGNKLRLIAVQSAGALCFSLSYIMLGNVAASLGNFLVPAVLLWCQPGYKRADHFDRVSSISVRLSAVLYAVLGVGMAATGQDGVQTLIEFATSGGALIIYAILMRYSEMTIRIGTVVCIALWILNNWVTPSYSGLLLNAFELISVIIGIYRARTTVVIAGLDSLARATSRV